MVICLVLWEIRKRLGEGLVAVEEDRLPLNEYVRDSCGLRNGFFVQVVGRSEPVDAGDTPEKQAPVISAAHGGGDDAP